MDIYGEPISLTYKGQSTYKTRLGATFTLILFTVLISYSLYRTYVLFNRINPDISKKGSLRNLDETGQYLPGETGFDVAFGLSKDFPPEIGHFTYKQVFYWYPEPEEG